MKPAVLALNSGSSSIKFALYSASPEAPSVVLRGRIGGIGRAPDFVARDGDGRTLAEDGLQAIDASADHGVLTSRLLDWLDDHDHGVELVAVGHRVVHGGQEFTGPVLIDETSFAELEALTPLAPLHQPHNLSAVKAIAERAPGLQQVACFDTAFHTTQPRHAQLFALPRDLTEEGIIRYGFHGLSYDYIADELPNHLGSRADGRVIVAHLGNGASLCAMKERQSVATSMGFTALDGLMMGRRCGALDPGVVLHLQQQRGMSIDEMHHLLYRESGLLGVSGISNSMQVLEESGEPGAREAIELYCYRAAQQISGLIPAISGLDALVFTAGIGENSTHVRQEICAQLDWLGIQIDPDHNGRNATTISAEGSKVDVLVIPTNEELVIARAAMALAATG